MKKRILPTIGMVIALFGYATCNVSMPRVNKILSKKREKLEKRKEESAYVIQFSDLQPTTYEPAPTGIKGFFMRIANFFKRKNNKLGGIT